MSTMMIFRTPFGKNFRLRSFSFAILVLAPTLFYFIYLFFLATNQYETEFRIQVKTPGSLQAPSFGQVLGMFGGGASGNNSYALIQFLESRDAIESLDKKIGLIRRYQKSDIDFISRLKNDSTIEDIEKFWQKKVKVFFEPTTETVIFRVKAFSPDDAKEIASQALNVSEMFLNEMSEKARKDALKYAETDVNVAELELENIERLVIKARKHRGVIDSNRQVAESMGRISKIKSELDQLEVEYRTRAKFTDKNSPIMELLEAKMASQNNALVAAKNSISRGDESSDVSLVETVAELDELAFKRNVATKRLEAAFSSLLVAQKDASRQQLYLDNIVKPGLPEQSIYPKVFVNSAALFFVLLITWLIGYLLIISINDHIRH